MIAPTAFVSPHSELPEAAGPVEVAEAEYHRLLGYPPDAEVTDRARELIQQTRAWYAQHGRPWRYFRMATLTYGEETVWIDGVPFHSPGLRQRFEAAGADRVVLAAVSAGGGCEQRAKVLWEEGKPDEYFFLEAYGSAVVEALITQLNARVCAAADRAGRFALPHYSPGYTDWDITEQAALLRAVLARLAAPLPEELRVLSSGMLAPRKALLGVIGLTPRGITREVGDVPCTECSFNPCQYRRSPYRQRSIEFSEEKGDAPSPPSPKPPARPREELPTLPVAHAESCEDGARASLEPPTLARAPQPLTPPPGTVGMCASSSFAYRTSERALRKWAAARVVLDHGSDGSVLARFRFDGTTCSNLGHPIALDYELHLGPPAAGRVILQAVCRPAPGDEGLRKTCAYLSGPENLERALVDETPPRGTPLDDALAAASSGIRSGCTCTTDGRAHKWSMALQAIHFALHHSS